MRPEERLKITGNVLLPGTQNSANPAPAGTESNKE
jgi:hypothetical protein